MRSKEEVERQLRFWIDCLVEDMGELCSSALKEEILIERRMKDTEFREELLHHIRVVVECRKLSEMQADVGMECAKYKMCATVSSQALNVVGPTKVQ